MVHVCTGGISNTLNEPWIYINIIFRIVKIYIMFSTKRFDMKKILQFKKRNIIIWRCYIIIQNNDNFLEQVYNIHM